MISMYCGDWIQVLKTLPDESVNCCVTSPPYWGLRDYGTAKWEGGVTDCAHEASERWYTEQTAASSSAEAFSVAGEANAERLKKGRWREKGECVKCGAVRVDRQLGLERTPDEYVAKMVEGFREVRRVLRKDGVLFLNMGDSYYSSPAKGGSGTPNGRNGRGEGYGRALRAASYDTSGKAPEGYQDRGCLCGSLCDACRVAYRIGKSHSGSRPFAMPTVSPSAPSRGRKESEHDHPPTLDSSLPEGRSVAASSGLVKTLIRADEQLRASLSSTSPQSCGQSQGECLQGGSLGGKCLLCAQTLGDYVQASSCNSGEIQGTAERTEGNASPYAARDKSTQYTCDYCLPDVSHTDYTTASLKPKDLCGIPWMVAFALRADGWYLRAQCPWIKRNPMPESVTDRPGTATETIFLLSKQERYFYDAEAVKMPAAGTAHSRGNGVNPKAKMPGANSRIYQDRDPSHPAARKPRQNESFSAAVKSLVEARGRRNHDWFMDSWEGLLTDEDGDPLAFVVNPAGFPEAHFATFPPKLVEPCILAGCPKSGTVLDPFAGSGTTGEVCNSLERNAILIDLNPDYMQLIKRRTEVLA